MSAHDQDEHLKYRLKLKRVAEELEPRDLQALKFLLKDHLPAGVLGEIQSNLKLFEELERKELLSRQNQQLLIELLYHAVRVDMMRVMGWAKVKLLHAVKKNGAQVSDFRLMLHEISEEMIIADIKRLKGIMKEEGFSPKQLEDADTYALFTLLEKQDKLRMDNVDTLICLLKQMNNPKAVAIAEKYKENHPSSCSKQTLEPLSLESTVYLPSVSVGMPAYRIEREPRGYCLIINNENFLPKPTENDQTDRYPDYNPRLQIRQGTKVDAECVTKTFWELGFKVEEYKDMTAKQIDMTLKHFSQRNHEMFDVFACFILSHGEQGLIYGTDCRSLAIQSLLSHFQGSNCVSLKNKPKLFFIQACQGTVSSDAYVNEHASLVYDGGEQPSTPRPVHKPPMPDQRAATASVLPVPDTQRGMTNAVKLPSEADFFIGLPTIPGYVSYRSKAYGTWYISALCNALMEKCDTTDLISIMTIVNNAVSRKDAKSADRTAKQMPLPVTTLRKRVYLKKVHPDRMSDPPAEVREGKQLDY